MLDISFETSENTSNDKDDVPIETAAYKTSDNAENSCNISIEEPPKKRNKFVWNILRELTDLDEALDFLEESGFVCCDYSDLKCGQKFYFRCKLIPKERKQWCAKRHTLFLPSNTMTVQILSNQFDHDHDALLEGTKRPITDEMKEYIDGLCTCGTTKTKEIIAHIDYARSKNGLFREETTPGNRQIEYLVQKFRSAQTPPMIKLGDLVEWCQENSQFPIDINEAFVIAHEASSHNDTSLSFRFVLSTPLLLQKCVELKTIAIDATYKLNWLDYPLMVYGTVDREKKFHPLAYACCSHEKTHDFQFIFESVKNSIKQHLDENFEPKTLIADGADAIRNAFYNCFESATLDIMCFAHVLRNCNKRPFTSKANKQLVMDDIRNMQLAPNRATFGMMTKLFCAKWERIESDFVTYFEKEWLGPHCNWFEGAANYTPSTNNALESHNAVIKRLITLRRRLPLNQFLICMKTMTSDISKQFSKGEREIAGEPNISKKIFQAAAMMGEGFKAFKAKQPANLDAAIFVIPSSKCTAENANESYYKTLAKTTWKSFDEFIVHGFQQFHIVHFSNEYWKSKSTCSCPVFFKQNICKHIVAIGARLGALTIPNTANLVPLARTKRKAGRPKRTATALALQN